MKTIKLFVAAAIVALAASCGAKEQPAEEAAPAATPEATDTTAVAPADTTAAAQ